MNTTFCIYRAGFKSYCGRSLSWRDVYFESLDQANQLLRRVCAECLKAVQCQA